MKSFLTIAVVAAVALSSCSVYRQGQTPDDVYYSPSREQKRAGGSAGYVETNSDRDDGRRYQDDNRNYSGYGYDDFATAEDRWLMMRVRNRYRWSAFDDFGMYNYYNPYSFYGPGFYSPFNYGFGGFQPGWSFGLGFGSYNPYGLGGFGYYNHFNSFYNWNNFYNPYYPGVVIIDSKSPARSYNRVRPFNLNNYSNSYNNNRNGSIRPRYNNSNGQYYNNNNSNRIRYNNSNNSSLEGTRRSSNRNNSYSPSQDRPVRTYSPSNDSYNGGRSSSGGSNQGGNSGGGGGGSRPTRR